MNDEYPFEEDEEGSFLYNEMKEVFESDEEDVVDTDASSKSIIEPLRRLFVASSDGSVSPAYVIPAIDFTAHPCSFFYFLPLS